MSDNDDKEQNEDIIIEPKLIDELLRTSVVNIMTELGLNINNCVGISTDDYSVMVSTLKKAVQHIQKFVKNAVYCHACQCLKVDKPA